MTKNDLNRFINSLLDDLVENNFYPILYRARYVYTIRFNPMFLCDFTQLGDILINHLAKLRKFSVSKGTEVRSDDGSVSIQFFIFENGINKYGQGFSCEFTIRSTTSEKIFLEHLSLTDYSKVSEAIKDLSFPEEKEAIIKIVDFKLH